MDFSNVLRFIIDDFNRKNVRYGLIGGFAMGAWGIMKSTMDLDFLVDSNDLNKIEDIMTGHMYKCIFKSKNVSQYISDLKPFGQVDFLHAFRKISISMLRRAEDQPIFEGLYTIRVILPEDIIGLKVQAAANDPSRESLEYSDIQLIMEHFREKLNWVLLRDYFELFNLGKRYEEFKEKYCPPE